jgi:hypothetical protein
MARQWKRHASRSKLGAITTRSRDRIYFEQLRAGRVRGALWPPNKREVHFVGTRVRVTNCTPTEPRQRELAEDPVIWFSGGPYHVLHGPATARSRRHGNQAGRDSISRFDGKPRSRTRRPVSASASYLRFVRDSLVLPARHGRAARGEPARFRAASAARMAAKAAAHQTTAMEEPTAEAAQAAAVAVAAVSRAPPVAAKVAWGTQMEAATEAGAMRE